MPTSPSCNNPALISRCEKWVSSLGHPDDHRAVTLTHDAGGGNSQRPDRAIGGDFEGRRHAGAQLMAGIVDLGARQQSMRVGVERAANARQFALERNIRRRGNFGHHRFADIDRGRIGLSAT